jgi:NAD(P)-dependent dehydrogenase (short-subunit alcohol dehydrogenase family)
MEDGSQVLDLEVQNPLPTVAFMTPTIAGRLAGRTALVTGSTSNIGRAIAVAFASEGAHLVVSGRSNERGDEVVDEIRAAGGAADFVAVDLDGSPERSRQLAEEATAVLGRVDILVNNAGIFPPGTTLDTGSDAFDRVYGVNVKAPYFLTAALAPSMIEAGGGVVINLGSWVARLGVPVGSLYASTKGAMETLTRAWSAEFASRGIRVNAISPGVVAGAAGHAAAGAGKMMAGTPANAVGPPAAIAAAAVYLASDEASFVHGTVLDVDGGRVAVAVLAG